MYKDNKNIIILAAGVSSRMKNSLVNFNRITNKQTKINFHSKALIELGPNNRPFLDYLLHNIEEAGYRNVYLVIGENADGFRKLYGQKSTNNTFGSLKVSYAIQFLKEKKTKPMGTADAVMQTLEQYPNLQKESFTVCNADNLYSVNALNIILEEANQNALICYDPAGLEFPAERISKFALVVLDINGNLDSIIEKPSESELIRFKKDSNRYGVSMNLWKLEGATIFPFFKNCPIHPTRNEKELPTAILNMVKKLHIKIKGIQLKELVPDLTSVEDISIVQTYISNRYK